MIMNRIVVSPLVSGSELGTPMGTTGQNRPCNEI
jgi:hypothetical protein